MVLSELLEKGNWPYPVAILSSFPSQWYALLKLGVAAHLTRHPERITRGVENSPV